MALHNEFGEQGEYEARLYLCQKGYTLLDKNWREGHWEIDIVAEYWGEIVFVEVKARSNENFAPAAEAVDLSKKRNIIAAAHAYLAKKRLLKRPYRYDIITVVGTQRPFQITHIMNAYYERSVYREAHHIRRNESEE